MEKLKVQIGSCLFCLLFVFATPVFADNTVSYSKLKFEHQTIVVRRADGSATNAKFLAELILLRDGRANGGFGIWESPSGPLTLYRVVEGNENGHSYSFKAKRLYPQPNPDIFVKITIDRNPTRGDGSVRFVTGGLSLGESPLTFTAKSAISEGSAPVRVVDSEFSFAALESPPQIVEIASPTGIEISNFNSAALVFPTVGAIGFFKLTSFGGPAAEYHYGTGVYKTMSGAVSWAFMGGAKNILSPNDEIMIVVRPDPDPSEPCRIYDILGTQGPIKHFEAWTTATSFTISLRRLANPSLPPSGW
jgi:hypothetical protein